MDFDKYIIEDEYLKFDPKIIDFIYYNDFIEFDINEINNKSINYLQTNLVMSEFDLGLNSNGFRSPEFKKNVEFLIAGCSVTFGIGLPIEKIWHEILLSKSEYSYASVAFEGDSIGNQIQKIFSYINKFGNPKNILLLLPELNRIKIFNKPDSFVCHAYKFSKSDIKHYVNVYKSISFVNSNHENEKYFKKPIDSEMIIPQEMAHMYAAQSINMLETYCYNLGINLIYGTWDGKTEMIFNKIKNQNYFKNFIELDCLKWHYYSKENKDVFDNSECHIDYKKDYFYNRAGDRAKGVDRAHFGSHRHIHYAEIFAKILKERFGYDFKN